jgi:hypothetical protein
MDAYLSKPIMLPALRETLARVAAATRNRAVTPGAAAAVRAEGKTPGN